MRSTQAATIAPSSPANAVKLAVMMLALMSVVRVSEVRAQERVELTLGSAKQTGREFIVDLGLVGIPSSQDVPSKGECKALGSFAASKTEIVVPLLLRASGPLRAIAVGSKVTVSLSPARPTGTAARSGRTYDLNISFKGGDAQTQDFNAVYLMRGDVMVAEIVVDYVLTPDRLIRQVDSGSVPSTGSRVTNWQDFNYGLTTGAPPLYYRTVRACGWLTGDRGCGSWSTCGVTLTDKTASMSFALQGHSEGQPAVRHSEGHLSVGYQLQPSAIKLTVASPR